MDASNGFSTARRTPLLVIAAIAAVLAVTNVLWWIIASAAQGTHAERVAHYLDGLPLRIGALGAFGATWLCIAVGAIGFTCATLAMSGRGLRMVPAFLAGANGLVVAWLLFTLM